MRHAYSLGDGNPLPNELNTSEAKMVIDKAADFGVDNMFITGAGWTGEPLMRKDFLEVLRYTSEFNLAPYVKVTGWRFDGKVANELASANCKAIISLAGFKEVDVFLRGKGAFEDSINAARLCKEYGVPFAISVINTKYVVNQVNDLVKLALSLGAKGFHLASLIPQPICVEEQLAKLGPMEPTPEAREKQLNEIYELEQDGTRQNLNCTLRNVQQPRFENQRTCPRTPQHVQPMR